jgi:hypothetical protein
MRRFAALASAAAVCGLLVTTLPAASALAAHHRAPAILTIRKVGGTAVAPGAILQGNLMKGTKATFAVSKTAGVVCTSVTFKDKVIKNPTRPGKSTELLIQQTFNPKSCRANNIAGDPTGAVKSVILVGLPKHPYPTSISDAKGNPVVVLGTKATLTLPTTIGTLSCTYAANKNTTVGHASNKAQSITFTAQPFHLVSGPPNACPHTGSFSAAFAPVKDTSVKGAPAVFIN